MVPDKTADDPIPEAVTWQCGIRRMLCRNVKKMFL